MFYFISLHRWYCLAGLFLWLLSMPAAQALTLSPATHRIQGNGQEQTLTVRCFNEGKQAVLVTPSIDDWGYDAQGEKIFRPAGSLPFSLAPYVSVDTSPFVLEPRQSRFVNLTLKVPLEKLGGYHAMAFFHATPYEPAPQPKVRSQVKMAVRLGSTLLYENRDSAVIASQITAAETKYIPGTTPRTEMLLKVKNTGNTWIEAQATVAVMDAADNFLGSFKLPRQIVLRGHSSQLQASWPQRLKPGRYQFLITYQYRGKSTSIVNYLTIP